MKENFQILDPCNNHVFYFMESMSVSLLSKLLPRMNVYHQARVLVVDSNSLEIHLKLSSLKKKLINSEISYLFGAYETTPTAAKVTTLLIVMSSLHVWRVRKNPVGLALLGSASAAQLPWNVANKQEISYLRTSYGSIPFLTRCVPDLCFDSFTVYLNTPETKRL